MGLFNKAGEKVNIQKAEEIFLKATELGKQQKWQEAIAQMSEVVRLNPKHAKAHMSLCMFYGAVLDLDSARKHYDILKKLDPDMANRLANSPAGMLILRTGSIIQF